MMRTEELKSAFKTFCARHGYKVERYGLDIGTARLFKHSGKYLIEVITKPNSSYVARGYDYPAGCTGLDESSMIVWLNAN